MSTAFSKSNDLDRDHDDIRPTEPCDQTHVIQDCIKVSPGIIVPLEHGCNKVNTFVIPVRQTTGTACMLSRPAEAS